MGTRSPRMEAFALACLRLVPGTKSGGIDPASSSAGGYHQSRNRLMSIGKTNDYSVRLAADRRGDGDRFCAWDWTFPDAQAGRYATIKMIGNRIRAAWQRRDPRLTGWREVLIRSDDGIAGYDFQPFSYRTPDDSHGWHGHFSVLRENVDVQGVYDNMFSIVSGESLEAWQARQNQGNDMLTAQERAWVNNADKYAWKLHTMNPTIPILTVDNGQTKEGTVESALVTRLDAMFTDVAQIKSDLQALRDRA
jgi:hypothetical protein